MLTPCLAALLFATSVQAAPTADEVTAAMHRAVDQARSHLAFRGGYVWWYAADGHERAGEGRPVPETTVWVQPPGTPAVGEAYLRLFEVTGDRVYLDAAVETARALAWGQLSTGGWYAYIHFGETPEGLRTLHYRRDAEAGQTRAGKRWATSTYDDDTTQSAMRLLLRVDHHLKGTDAAIHRALEVGLAALLGSQYPAGAWPQVFPAPQRDQPVLPASLPADWPRIYPPNYDYWFFYTLNDDVLRHCVDTLLLAWWMRGDEACRAAAVRAGEFLLRAQLPEPHRGWAQQYNFAMEPCWARKFEPPAASTWETAGALEVLAELWLETGDERFPAAMRPALDWLRAVRLADGRWARFHELGTGRPLYMTSDYQLTYSDADTPAHYGFKQEMEGRVAGIEELLARGRETVLADRARTPTRDEWRQRAAALAPQVAEALAAQDEQGRWVTTVTHERGRPLRQPRQVIESAVLIQRLGLLADYLEAVKAADG